MAIERRSRLAPEVRRALLIDAACKVVLEQGSLPVPIDQLARAASVSKALVYAYFPTQPELFNAVLAREFEAMTAAGIVEASRRPALLDACVACASIYFEHVASSGPLAHIVLRDQFMSGRLSRENRAFRDGLLGRLARAARDQHRLPPKEAVAALNMILTIPEETGRLVYAGQLDLEKGRALSKQLVTSAVEALAPVR